MCDRFLAYRDYFDLESNRERLQFSIGATSQRHKHAESSAGRVVEGEAETAGRGRTDLVGGGRHFHGSQPLGVHRL